MSRNDKMAFAVAAILMPAIIAATLYAADRQQVDMEDVKNVLLRELSDDIASGARLVGRDWVKIALLHDGRPGSRMTEAHLSAGLGSTGFVRVIDHDFIQDIAAEAAGDAAAAAAVLPLDYAASVGINDLRQSADRLVMDGSVVVSEVNFVGEDAIYEVKHDVERSVLDPVYLMISLGRVNPLFRLFLLVAVLLCIPFVLSPWSVSMFRGGGQTRKILVLAKHILTGILFVLFYFAFELSLLNIIFGVPIVLLYSFYAYRYLIAVEESLAD